MNYQHKHIRIQALLALVAVAIIAATSTRAAGIPPIRIGCESSFIEVTTLLDEDNGYAGGGSGISLREAVRYSEPGSMIILKNGVYELNQGGLSTLSLTHDIVLKGSGKGSTIISGSEGAVFRIPAGVSVTIAEVTIQNGNAAAGGAILNNGSLSLYSTALTGNTATDGGAIYNTGNLEMHDVILSGNRAAVYGGAIFNDGGRMEATNSAFLRNISLKGGGLYNQFGNCRIADCTILGNTSGSGGGIADFIGITELQNTSAADNFGGNFSGIILTLGNNFDSDGSGRFASINQDPASGYWYDSEGNLAALHSANKNVRLR